MGGDSPFQFTVVARDVNGLVITTDQTVVWQIVGDSSAGQIDTTGKFTALKAGAVRLKASIGDIIGQSAQIMMIEKIPGDSTGSTPTVAYPDGQPDGKVDIFDLVNMARHWHQTENSTTASIAEFKEMDISDQPNSDGKIDVFDLVILASNYGKGMTPTLAAPSILATLPIYEDAVSDLRVVTSSVTDQSADQIRSLLANQIELDVFLDQVEGLYAYSFDLVYDQEKVHLVMQDDGQPVFEKGSILGIDAGATHSLVSPTLSGDDTGLASVNVTATHLGQKSSAQQSGSLGRLQLRTKAAGQSQLQV